MPGFDLTSTDATPGERSIRVKVRGEDAQTLLTIVWYLRVREDLA